MLGLCFQSACTSCALSIILEFYHFNSLTVSCRRFSAIHKNPHGTHNYVIVLVSVQKEIAHYVAPDIFLLIDIAFTTNILFKSTHAN